MQRPPSPTRFPNLAQTAESAGEWLSNKHWSTLQILVWLGIGLILSGLPFTLNGLQGLADRMLIWLNSDCGLGALTSFCVPFLLIRILAFNLIATHTKFSRATGALHYSPVLPGRGRGRFVLFQILIAGMDATILHLIVFSTAIPIDELLLPRSGLIVKIPVCLLIIFIYYLFQTWVTVFWLNKHFVKRLRQLSSYKVPLMVQRNSFLREHESSLLTNCFISVPIVLATLVINPDSNTAFSAILAFLIVKAFFESGAEAISILLDYRNGMWIKRHGARLLRRKTPAARLALLVRMAKLADLAGPSTWPELAVALRETETQPLSGQLVKLGIQYVFYLTERDVAGANGVGEVIQHWYPGSEMAAVVQDQAGSLQMRALTDSSQEKAYAKTGR